MDTRCGCGTRLETTSEYKSHVPRLHSRDPFVDVISTRPKSGTFSAWKSYISKYLCIWKYRYIDRYSSRYNHICGRLVVRAIGYYNLRNNRVSQPEKSNLHGFEVQPIQLGVLYFLLLFQSSKLKARTSLSTELWAFENVTSSWIGCT